MPFNDGFRHLRNQIENSPILYSAELNFTLKAPVISRTETSFLSEFPEALLDSVTRRSKHDGTGLFTPAQQPYRAFGNMKHTDPFEWVADYFGVTAPTPSILYQGKGPYLHDDCRDGLGAATGALFEHTICVARTAKQKEQYPYSHQAGLSTIQLHLAADQHTMVEVQCGSCYTASLDREKDRQELLKGRRFSLLKGYMPHPPTSGHNGGRLHRQHATSPHTLEAVAHSTAQQYEQNMAASKVDKVHCKQVCYMKMRTVYTLLCCINNIKARDLRNKEPLTHSALKMLSRRPFQTVIKTPLYYASRRSSTTWGLLVSSRDITIHHDNSAAVYLGPTVGPMGRHAAAKIVPAWQRDVVFIDTEEVERRNRDLETKLKDSYQVFQCRKNELAKQLRDRLHEREQVSRRQLLHKLTHLKLGANPGEQLHAMRMKAYRLERNDLKDTRPKWYIALEDEATDLFSDDDELQWKEVLDSLKQFNIVDIDSIPHAVEKLCLVAMSYPAHKLCTEPVIDAMKFTLEHVLKTSPRLLSHWMEIRRIPCLT